MVTMQSQLPTTPAWHCAVLQQISSAFVDVHHAQTLTIGPSKNVRQLDDVFGQVFQIVGSPIDHTRDTHTGKEGADSPRFLHGEVGAQRPDSVITKDVTT
jgi:hypothetical protein